MGTGMTVRLSASTMAVMGSTEERDSKIFSFSFWLIRPIPFLQEFTYL